MSLLLLFVICVACICIYATVATRINVAPFVVGGLSSIINYAGSSTLMTTLMKLPFDDAKYKHTVLSANKYIVGENEYLRRHHKRPTVDQIVAPCYDLDYTFVIHPTDTIIQGDLARGIPFEKVLISALSAFMPLRVNDAKPLTMFDVGANIGTVSIPLSRAAQVYSFEPFYANFALLKENIRINNSTAIPLCIAIGDKTRKSVSLSSAVRVSPKEKAHAKSKSDYKEIDDKLAKINFGAIQLGMGGQSTPMYTIDDLSMDVDIIKVDVEGAEPLVFWGARDTIARCLPIIAFERNDATISRKICKASGCVAAAANFDIVAFCHTLGYNAIYQDPGDNFILTHPSHTPRRDAEFKYRPIGALRRQRQFDTRGYTLYDYGAPWL